MAAGLEQGDKGLLAGVPPDSRARCAQGAARGSPAHRRDEIVMSLLARIRRKLALLERIDARLIRLQEALGRVEARQARVQASARPQDYEFQVYSQWGEDGIIDWLTNQVSIENKVFIEFGVEDYTEANTRFLLMHRNWSGLVIDSSEDNIKSIKQQDIYWRYNLKAV